MDVKVKQFPTLNVNPLTVNPLTIAQVEKVAPVGVHIKELNQIAPLSVELLRVDHVRHVDPLRIDRLNITQLPSVNITMSQLPALDLNVRRVPPVTIALHQQFEMTSSYSMMARIFGLKLMRLDLSGTTRITPRNCDRREVSRQHERSFADVAAASNPAIPSRAVEKSCTTVARPPNHHHRHRHKPRRRCMPARRTSAIPSARRTAQHLLGPQRIAPSIWEGENDAWQSRKTRRHGRTGRQFGRFHRRRRRDRAVARGCWARRSAPFRTRVE